MTTQTSTDAISQERFLSDMANENNAGMVDTTHSKLIAMIDPNAVMRFGLQLKSYITKNKLSVNIQGKEYAMVDGWKFAGMNFGIVPMVSEPKRMHENNEKLYVHKKNQKDRYGKQVQTISLITRDKEMHEQFKEEADATFIRTYYAYECSCKLISIQTGKEIGSGHAICTNAESKKSDFDEYAVASMSQTRAIGKAFRNLLGYVMNAVGYESTPAEEMEEETYHTSNKKTSDKAKDETLQEIFDLISHEVFTDDFIAKIQDAMHTFTQERADRCVEFLKEEIAKKGGAKQ